MSSMTRTIRRGILRRNGKLGRSYMTPTKGMAARFAKSLSRKIKKLMTKGA